MTPTVVVHGLGEMGASFACALGTTARVIGVDHSEATCTTAVQNHVVTAAYRDLTAVPWTDVDFLVLATPVHVILATLAQLNQLPLPERLIVTDLGSTKTAIMAAAEQYLAPARICFIGGHPMAGTQRSGVAAADALLYQDRAYLLLPSQQRSDAAVTRLTALLAPLQSRILETSLAEHDAVMATVSDLPHVAAYALMQTAHTQLGPSAAFAQYVAGGFQDTTRIAASDPEVWTDILLSNKDAVLASLQVYQAEVAAFADELQAGDADRLQKHIRAAQHNRQQLGEITGK